MRTKIPDERFNKTFNEVLNSSKIVFEKFKSERDRFLLYEQRELMIKPVAISLGRVCKEKKRKA